MRKRPTKFRSLSESLRAKGISQGAFARSLGLSASYISLIVRGLRVPPLDVAMLIALHASVPIESLLTPGARHVANRRTK